MGALAERRTLSQPPPPRRLELLSSREASCEPTREAALEPNERAAIVEPPAETDAWWLSRSQQATFSRRRVPLPPACARALGALIDAQIAVEFNGMMFEGARVATRDGVSELELGEPLTQEMAEVLDEDDGLDIEWLEGRARPTLAIHPFASFDT